MENRIQNCRKLLNADLYGYTDEEVLMIDDFLDRLSKIDIALYKTQCQPNSLKIIKEDNDETKPYLMAG